MPNPHALRTHDGATEVLHDDEYDDDTPPPLQDGSEDEAPRPEDDTIREQHQDSSEDDAPPLEDSTGAAFLIVDEVGMTGAAFLSPLGTPLQTTVNVQPFGGLVNGAVGVVHSNNGAVAIFERNERNPAASAQHHGPRIWSIPWPRLRPVRDTDIHHERDPPL